MSVKAIISDLKQVASQEKADFLPGFFRAHPGGYGEGDKFLGVVVPEQRKIARRYRDLPRNDLLKLLNSPWHECRMTGLLILVLQFERSQRGKDVDEGRAREIVDFYLDNLDAANNWDLVDASAPKILGPWLLDHPKERTILRDLSDSDVIWRRRVAVVANYPLIRSGQYDPIVQLAGQLVDDPHDLIHKAVGWMMREVGKQDQAVLVKWLEENAHEMPRVMLRYAIERLPKSERDAWRRR